MESGDEVIGRGAVVVTGASTGIGRATALELDRIGFRVFAGVRKDSDAESIRGDGSDRLEPLTIDVADEASVDAAAKSVAEKIGDAGLAGLVNNAGIVVAGPLEGLPLDELRRQLEVNVVAQVGGHPGLPARASQSAGADRPDELGRGPDRRSPSWPRTTPRSGASRRSGTRCALELKPWGIDVVIVEPGAIATPFWQKGQDTADEVEGNMDPEIRDLYEEQLEAVRGAARKSEAEGIPPERVAEVVAEALTSDRPKTRYLVGRDAKLNARVRRIVPDRLFDRLISRELGLK